MDKKKPEDVSGRPVIVTTAHRGVFFGYAMDADIEAWRTNGTGFQISNARNAIYWSSDVQGFMGLASKGPTSGCRIGPPATITLRDITSVLEVTPEAEGAWLKAKFQM